MSGIEKVEDEATSNELALFKASLHNILKQVSTAVSLENFTEIFKDVPPLMKKPSRLKTLWEIHQQTMLDDMVVDMETFICEEDLNKKLKQISQMRDKTCIEVGKIAWRPTLLSTERYMRTYDMQSKEGLNKKLEEVAVKKEQRLKMLRQKVILGRAKAAGVKEVVQRAREKLKKEINKDTMAAKKLRAKGISIFVKPTP